MISKERNKVISVFDERSQDDVRGLRLSLGERGLWFYFGSGELG